MPWLPNMTPRKQLYIILCVFVGVVCLDQYTKYLVIKNIPVKYARRITDREAVPSFEGIDRTFFYFTHERNPGMVGGIFGSIPLVAKAAPVAATLVLIYLFRHLNRQSRLQAIAYGLLCGGAVGNLIDRFRLGSVTDFLQFHFYFVPFDFPWKRYPAFNVADSAICIGVALLLFGWHHVDNRKRGEDHVPDSSENTDPVD